MAGDIDPLFWLGLSILLVSVSLTAVLIAALPALQELARAARSAEKLFDTLQREFPPTLKAIRLTGIEITELTEELNEGVKSASVTMEEVDRSVRTARQQVSNVRVGAKSAIAGFKAAWQTWKRSGSNNQTLPGFNSQKSEES